MWHFYGIFSPLISHETAETYGEDQALHPKESKMPNKINKSWPKTQQFHQEGLRYL